jgi:hypothetical protein
MKYDVSFETYKTKTGNFKIGSVMYYKSICPSCGDTCLTTKNGKYCNRICSRLGKFHTEETKRKISLIHKNKSVSEITRKNLSNSMSGRNNGMFGKKHTEETKQKISKTRENYKGENHPNWKGGVTKNNIPFYNTFFSKLELIEECRKTEEGCLEVKCTYCGKWFIPKRNHIKNRIESINKLSKGESRLYCNTSCKYNCPIYRQRKYEKGYKPSTSREVQPELRKLVFQRDDWTCIKCGSQSNLHCHHIEGIVQNPIESADMDLCITLCKLCHKEVHKQKDCRYNDLRCK